MSRGHRVNLCMSAIKNRKIIGKQEMHKASAFNFLRQFQRSLISELPTVALLRSNVRQIASAAKGSDGAPHMRRPEEAFLNTYVIPRLYKDLQLLCGLSQEQARSALLSENFRHLPEMCFASPARKERHPFEKRFPQDPAKILARWRSGTANSLHQSCPDFALRSPCPYSIVFEGKYFESGSIAKAEAELVRNIYQAFFYRGLPKIEETKSRPAWDYEFACLLACDASPEGFLKRAWDSLEPAVQEGFWSGANVYVMIIRGDS